MNVQISFTADELLKQKAVAKAKAKGITLKSLFIFSMEAFINDSFDIGIIPQNASDVERLDITDKKINKSAQKLTQLLQ